MICCQVPRVNLELVKGTLTRGSQHRSANVAVPVVVAPALVVSVFHRSGIETFESFREILHEAGLILDGRKGGRRSCNKHGGETLF